MARRPNVLIVDDDEHVCAFLVRLLAAKGYAARCARDEADAAALLKREPADLLIVDVVLGCENGYHAAARLHGDTPFVMITGALVDEDARRDAALLGASGVVAKPFDAAEMLALVGRLVPRPPL